MKHMNYIYSTVLFSVVIYIGPDPEDPPCKAYGVAKAWLKRWLIHHIVKWCKADYLDTNVSSLKLMGVDVYSAKYQQLKVKYGPKLVEVRTFGCVIC